LPSSPAPAADPGLEQRVDEPTESTESTEYVGRAVVALQADPDVLEKTGRLIPVGESATEYGFTDLDGSQPIWPPAKG